MSESARGEGGRVWVPRDKHDKRTARSIPEADRYYFLEERYPKYGNLVPRDIATREIFKIVYEDGMGIDNQPMVYLDLTHLSKERLHKLEGILEIYEKFVGDDPREVPMKIFPGMHYTMGGLWVDFEQQTNIPGVFAAGEADYSIHGGQSPGREFPAELHLWRLRRGAKRDGLCKVASRAGWRRWPRGRVAAAARAEQGAAVLDRHGEPVQAVA